MDDLEEIADRFMERLADEGMALDGELIADEFEVVEALADFIDDGECTVLEGRTIWAMMGGNTAYFDAGS